MYCLSKNGSNLVEIKSINIECSIKEMFEDGNYTEHYKLLANKQFYMTSFKTLDEAKVKLKDVMLSIKANRNYYEFE